MPAQIHTFDRIVELYNQGKSMQEISRIVNYAYPSVRKFLQKQGLSTSSNRIASRRKPFRIDGHGYRELFLPNHPNANCDGYVKEHVKMVVDAIDRPLKRGEVIHHVNGDKLDNRNDNFVLCDSKYHMELHARMGILYQNEHFPKRSKECSTSTL